MESGLISRRMKSLIVFRDFPQETGLLSHVSAGWPVKIHICSVTSGLLSSCEGYLRIPLEKGSAIRNHIQMRQ